MGKKTKMKGREGGQEDRTREKEGEREGEREKERKKEKSNFLILTSLSFCMISKSSKILFEPFSRKGEEEMVVFHTLDLSMPAL